jgi:pilus assembly protein Flp/PilA
MIRLLKKLHIDERGATAIEYALIISLIFLAMAGALASVADTTTNMWNNVSSEVKQNT